MGLKMGMLARSVQFKLGLNVGLNMLGKTKTGVSIPIGTPHLPLPIQTELVFSHLLPVKDDEIRKIDKSPGDQNKIWCSAVPQGNKTTNNKLWATDLAHLQRFHIALNKA